MKVDLNNMSHQVLMAVILELYEDEGMSLHDVIELCQDAATEVYYALKNKEEQANE